MSHFSSLFPPRDENAHKGNFGHVLLIAGSQPYSGAPRLAISGALRSGVGLVSCCVPGRIWEVVASWEASAMTIGLGEDSSYVGPEHLEIIQNLLDRCQALVIGPGLGREPGTTQLLRTLLANTPLPAVLDADALWHFPLLSLPAKSNWVLTPHEGEFLRLGGDLSAREAGAAKLASTLGCVVHLKGHQSVTASPRGSLLINTTGNPGMAKGGSGDILAGLTGGFLARGISPEEAVAAAAWLLGTSADLCASEMGMEAMLPTDTLKFLPLAWKKGLE